MARQYVVTEEEMLSLVESMELEKMRMNGHFRQMDATSQEIQDVHRAFHFVAVRWVQAMGFQGYRK
ncbi:hypothetical protein CVO77_00150 [Sphingopyxis lindanitolerans]|uniref:Uncharacterized protein n=1 Tax=Sphingopyxis lindanitolerans TaxID=2054227 RepID=A0A2S8BAM7_9SPHN|nr:hypothetical protein [Sphingopyxis lindanitolerans]PQM29386.1 hypothetical protein CVO77_00150 [Sphingopyxis lindanitolerans]